MAKFTFLLPAYKGKYLKEALNSILSQTYKDFKVIVSDDCSPEDLKSIFDATVGDDPRFVYRCNEHNMGGKSLVAHWNLLVDMCDTEFFMMASDDDIYEPEYLQEIDKLTKKYPEIDLYRPRIRMIEADGTPERPEPRFSEFMSQVAFFRMTYLTESLYCEAAYCYRTKSFIEKGKYVDTPLAWYTDNATHIQMAERGCAITDDILFNFRMSSSSISGTGNSHVAAEKVKATFMFWEWIQRTVEKMPNDNDSYWIKWVAMDYCKSDVLVNINNYLPRCSRKDFFHYLPMAQKTFALSRVIMTYNWLLIQYHKYIR